jgi:hypothetical protein
MAVEMLVAGGAGGLPAAVGHLHFIPIAAFGFGPDFAAFGFPHGIMSMSGAYQRMGDLM